MHIDFIAIFKGLITVERELRQQHPNNMKMRLQNGICFDRNVLIYLTSIPGILIWEHIYHSGACFLIGFRPRRKLLNQRIRLADLDDIRCIFTIKAIS